MKKTLIALILIFISVNSYAIVSDIGLDPMDQTSGARPLGMGGAFIAMSGDVSAMFYNPAALSDSKGLIASARDGKNFALGAAYETNIGNIGFGIIYKNYDGFADNDIKTTYDHSLGMFDYGFKYGQFSFGLGLKTLLSQKVTVSGQPDIASNSGFDMDAGTIWKPINYASFGLVLHNLVGAAYTMGASDETFPKTTKIGLAIDLVGTDSMFNNDTYGLKIAYDSESGLFGDSQTQNSYFGVEGSFNNWFYLRLGASSIFAIDSNVNCSSFGVGYKFSDSSLDIASYKDPFTGSQLAYLSFTYSPPKFMFFEEAPVEVQEGKQEVKIKKLLSATYPSDDYVTYDDTIIVSGEVRPGATVIINGVNAYVDSDGKFAAVQSLIPGKNLIEVDVRSNGERSVVTKKVLRKAKVVIAEEERLNKTIAQEITGKEEEIKARERDIAEQKNKGIDVSKKEQLLQEDKTKLEVKKVQVQTEKKKLEDRKEKVENLVTLGVVEVAPDKSFEIEVPIKRGEMITWLVKAAGIPIPKVGAAVFSDVPQDNEYAPFIKAALDFGLIKRPANNKFRPNDPVTESEGQEFFKAFGIVK